VEVETSLRHSDRFYFIDFPLRRALRKLADRHAVKIIWNVPDEGGYGITPSTRITLDLNDYTLRGTLRRLLEPLRLTFEVRDHAIWVVEVPDPE
jgi:hypothetical protein